MKRYDELLYKMNGEEDKFEQFHQTYEQTFDKVNSFEQYNPINLEDLGLFKNLGQHNTLQVNPDQNIINLQDTSDTLQKLNPDFTTHINDLPFCVLVERVFQSCQTVAVSHCSYYAIFVRRLSAYCVLTAKVL